MKDILGYSEQSDAKVGLVNENKVAEEEILRMLDAYTEMGFVDKRWLAIARTQMEQGFMALNRAIFKPTRIKLQEDAT